MNWFGILKEDKVLPKMREFQFAGEKANKPEVEDDRCRKRLKEKFLRLKERNESWETYSGKFDDEIQTQLAGHGDTGYVNIKGHQSIDRLVEIFDKVSEEMCCGILEAIQEMVVAGRNWYTARIKEADREEFYDAMDFPLWEKNVSIPDEYGFNETANISLFSGFWLANRLNFSLSLHRKDEDSWMFHSENPYGYRFSLEYQTTGWEGRPLGTVDEDADIRFRQNLIVFMNFILAMRD